MSGHSVPLYAALALAALAAPAAADVKAGVDAWSAGDFERAVAEWRGPARAGDADAMFNLAQAYRLGRGVPADIERARELYAEAARKGHLKAADNYGLLLFQQGEREEALPLIRAAADRGDPRAQYVLGLCHFNALHVEKDWVRAYALMTLATGSGLPQASEALAQMDEFIPMQQRQKAQLLAREIEVEAGKRRAAELAAADLGAAQPAPAAQPSAAAIAAPAASARAPAAAPAARGGDWSVQLGAFGVSGNAERLWQRLADHPALAGATRKLIPAGRITRLLAVGFASRGDADRACSQLKAQGQACLVTKAR